MPITQRATIYDASARPDAERIAYFTSLCPLASGTILSGFQVGPSKHSAVSTIRLARSRDAGRTWHDLPARFETRIDGVPGSLASAEMVEAEPGRVLLFATWFDRTEPERPLFDPVTEGILRSRTLLAESHDEGENWSAWRTIPTPGLTGCATTGPVTRWADGTIAYAFESFKEFDDTRPGHHAAWVLVSRDGGRSFEPPWRVAQHPEHALYYWDQRLCPTDVPGEFIALFWTHDRAAQRDRAVHILRASIDQPSSSHALPTPTPIRGQIAAPLWLGNGRVAALVVDRGEPCTISLWQSADGGETWPESQREIIYRHDERAALTQGLENIDFKQYWEDMGKWSFGHPAIRRLTDNRWLLAWYAGAPDRMSVHSAWWE